MSSNALPDINSIKTRVGIVAVFALLLYLNTFTNGWNIDDPNILINNNAVYGLSIENIKAVFTSLPNGVEYLPVRDVSYMLDYSLWGLNPTGYHISNALYYAFACALFYLFLESIGLKSIALVSAMIYASHPVHVESVAGIAQRKDVLSAVFFFLSLLLYQKAGRNKSAAYFVLSLLSFALSMLSKTTSLVFPGILFVSALILDEEDGVMNKLYRLIPFVTVGAGFAYLGYVVSSSAGAVFDGGGGLIDRAPTAFRATAYYLKMLFVPYPLMIFHDFELSRDFFESAVLASMGLVAGLIYIGLRERRKEPFLSFAIFSFLVCLPPVVGLLPTSTIIAERYLMLPSMGFAIFVGWVFMKCSSRIDAKIPTAVVVGILLLFSVVVIKRNSDWKEMQTLIKADLSRAPESYKLNDLMGRTLFMNGRHDEAMEYFKKARAINPSNMNLEFWSAYRCFEMKDYPCAIDFIEKIRSAYKIDIIDVEYLYGRVFEATGERQQAKSAYERAYKSKIAVGVFFKRDVIEAMKRLG